jgi:lysozyme family protein
VIPLDTLIARLIAHEGGVADAGDGMGVTRYGQTPAWLAQFMLPAPDSPQKAADNYLAWLKVTGLLPLISPGDDLSDILLDIAVMSTAPKAVKALQAVLKVPVDGVLGPMTQYALDRADRKQLARDVIAWDMGYQARMVTLDPTRLKFLVGWTERMADHVRRLA